MSALWLKIRWTLLPAMISCLLPVAPVVAFTFILVLVDFISGIWAAHKRGETITSEKMRRTIPKLLGYELVLILGFLVGKYMVQMLPVLNIVSSVIGLTEFKSFLENISDITGSDVIQNIVTKFMPINPLAASLPRREEGDDSDEARK